jgi:aminoglycoside/choline kinase family phosphotransferase
MGAPETPLMTRNESAQELETRVAEVVAAQWGATIARFEPLSGALGTRVFARVWLDSRAQSTESIPATAIARIENPEDPARRPADVPPEPPLEPIRGLLEDEGLPVPLCYGADDARSVTLLEDLGTVALADVANSLSQAERESYYREACDLVPRLQRIAPRNGVAAFGRSLNDALFRYKAERFARWSLGGDRGASPAEAEVVRDAFERIGRIASEAPQRLAHRDLQSANLHVVTPSLHAIDLSLHTADRSLHAANRFLKSADPARTTMDGRPARLVMIDLQGAFMAPPEYDLVCLLRDSYVELDDAAVDAHLARARTALPDQPDEELFRLRFDLLTLTRKAKDHALFRAVAAERGDDRYLQYLPATRRYLQKASSRVASKLKEYNDLNDLIQAIPEHS